MECDIHLLVPCDVQGHFYDIEINSSLVFFSFKDNRVRKWDFRNGKKNCNKVRTEVVVDKKQWLKFQIKFNWRDEKMAEMLAIEMHENCIN